MGFRLFPPATTEVRQKGTSLLGTGDMSRVRGQRKEGKNVSLTLWHDKQCVGEIPSLEGIATGPLTLVSVERHFMINSMGKPLFFQSLIPFILPVHKL